MSAFLSKSFAATLKEFDITGVSIAKKIGASPSQISDFKNGKRNLSSAQLERVMIAMDAIAPGSRLHFCLLAAGSIEQKQLSVLLKSVADRLESISSDELVGILT